MATLLATKMNSSDNDKYIYLDDGGLRKLQTFICL